jgi:hypothetical protein
VKHKRSFAHADRGAASGGIDLQLAGDQRGDRPDIEVFPAFDRKDRKPG